MFTTGQSVFVDIKMLCLNVVFISISGRHKCLVCIYVLSFRYKYIFSSNFFFVYYIKR